MAFCKSCGTQLLEDAAFCYSCGATIDQEELRKIKEQESKTTYIQPAPQPVYTQPTPQQTYVQSQSQQAYAQSVNSVQYQPSYATRQPTEREKANIKYDEMKKQIKENESEAIFAYYQKAKTAKTLGIIAAILCAGIGFIFSIIVFIMLDKMTTPTIKEADEEDRELFHLASHHAKTARTLARIPGFVILGTIVTVTAIVIFA